MEVATELRASGKGAVRLVYRLIDHSFIQKALLSAPLAIGGLQSPAAPQPKLPDYLKFQFGLHNLKVPKQPGDFCKQPVGYSRQITDNKSQTCSLQCYEFRLR